MALCKRRKKQDSTGLIGLVVLASTLGGLKLITDRIVRRAEKRYPPMGDFVTFDGVRLHYVSRGSGRPVVLIHGDGGSVCDWTMSIFDRLAEDYRVIAFDRPGLGYSERPEDGGSPFVQADVIHRALEILDVEQPILVGHSRGGNVALAYGLVYPGDVVGLVTLAPAPYGVPVPPLIRSLSIPLVGPLLAHTVYVPFGRNGVEAGLETAFAPEGPPPPDYLDVYAAYELRPRQLLAHAHDHVRGRESADAMAERYAALRVPLVVVHGTADRNVPVEQARRLHHAAPRSRLIEIEGAGHEVMFLHPEVVLDALEQVSMGKSQIPHKRWGCGGNGPGFSLRKPRRFAPERFAPGGFMMGGV